MITNKNLDLNATDFTAGESILIDKPKGWSSFKVISFVRKRINVKKVGHAGTLDPAATGLLIVCTGKKTKEINTFQDLDKTYTGTIQLGIRTASMDLETEVIAIKSFSHITEEDIYNAKKQFEGEIEQIPPMYSAIKVNGVKLYNLARKGKTIQRSSRKITVYSFEILNIELPVISFRIKCSKGTYIRTIADDLGSSLGTGGVLTSLRRTAIGDYSVDDAVQITMF